MRIPETIEDAIWKAKRVFPELSRWTPEVPVQGGQNFTIFFGENVVRLPRHEACIASLKTEAQMLARISGQDLGVHKPKLINFDADNHIMIISKLSGRPLNAFSLAAMKETDQENIGMQIGTFLHELHRLNESDLSPEEYASANRAYNASILLRLRQPGLAENLGMPLARLEDIDRYLRNFKSLRDKISWLQGDIAYSNILFDADKKSIAIVDFTSAKQGYNHEDFLLLGGFPAAAQEACLEIYNDLEWQVS